jgi:hypothetical protein
VDATAWVPIRWPCGPLEIERVKAVPGVTTSDVLALRQWSEPALLDRIAGSPVSCLVVPWAEGSERDGEHQRSLVPLLAAARQRGLALVGWSGEKADTRRALQAARDAGLDAIATGATDAPADAAVLRFRDQWLADRSPSDFVGAFGPAWPGLRVTTSGDVDAETGPTGPPWLNSNAWYVRLARALVQPKTLWLAFEPPEIGQPVAAVSYAQAVADSAIHGGRWLVSLDQRLRVALAADTASARATCAALAQSLAFFEAHRAWAGYDAVGQLGVVSDYAGPHAFLAFEVLNLLARQGSLARIVETRRVHEATSLEGLDAVLYVDAAPPDRDVARKLYAFAEAGGALITPPGREERGAPSEGPWLPGFRLLRHGAGRLAVAREDFADPYRLAEDAQLVMSHRHDRLRIFNPGTSQSHYLASGDGRAGVLHTLSYQAPGARTPTGVWFRRAWKEGQAWSLDGARPVPAARSVAEPGVEFQPPPVSVYSALELLG